MFKRFKSKKAPDTRPYEERMVRPRLILAYVVLTIIAISVLAKAVS